MGGINAVSNAVGIYILIVCVSLLVITVVINQMQVRRTLKRLDNMLEAAISGTFNTDTIDESMLSSLEFKFARYLGAAALSARNSANEKEKIKTLISDISHQTKTPISNIMLYSELLQEQDLDKTSVSYAKALTHRPENLIFLLYPL